MIGLNEGFGKSPARIPPVVDLSYDLFADSGLLVKTLGLEHRPQQSRMAECVAEAFAESQSLLFEAGTGVGKSLAYLIPGLIHAIETE
ncbi:MAG: ATP-dependent DNA helicase, partial [Opitutales bacterium]|nr:ATP-dependent DNA helicase [Opitutales bacterium]